MNRKIDLLVSDRIILCCVAKHVTNYCTFEIQFPSMCGPLLPSVVVQYLLWVLLITNIVSSGLALLITGTQYGISRKRHSDKRQGILALKLSMHAADILFTIYTGTILVVNIVFQNQFIIYSVQWLSGATCIISGCLFYASQVVTGPILCLVSYKRCKSIISPLKHTAVSVNTSHVVILLCYIASGLVAFISFYIKKQDTQSRICSLDFVEIDGVAAVFVSAFSVYYLFLFGFI